MGLQELRDENLLLPESHWGEQRGDSLRGRAGIVTCGVLALAAILCVWVGQGAGLTFVGIGLFLVDLFLFLRFTFHAVDRRVHQLTEMGLEGQVEGFPARIPDQER